MLKSFGVRRLTEAATALWIATELDNLQSGVALGLPPLSKNPTYRNYCFAPTVTIAIVQTLPLRSW